MKLLTSISCFVLMLFTLSMYGQRATESDAGILKLKNGTSAGINLDGGTDVTNDIKTSGSISLNDGLGKKRISIYGGGQFLDPDSNTDAPLLKMTGSVPLSNNKAFIKFKNDAPGFNDTWDIGLSPSANLSSLAFTYINTQGVASTPAIVTVNGVFQSSDKRLKTNIKTINSTLPSLMKLNPTNYNRKINLGQEEYGFIAQEVEKIYPDMISVISTEDGEGQFMMNYTQLIPILTKGIQEQQEIIENQKQQIESMLERLTVLEGRL